MPWNVTNRETQPMRLRLDDATDVTAAPGVPVAVNSGIQAISYNGNVYRRQGIWPFPPDQNVDASYGGAFAPNHCYVESPETIAMAVYPKAPK